MAPDRDHLQRWGRYAHAVATWERITQTPAPKPTITNQADELRPSPVFVEWLMGLPTGWITNPQHGLTPNQQLTALGNGVLPLHAVSALSRRRELGW